MSVPPSSNSKRLMRFWRETRALWIALLVYLLLALAYTYPTIRHFSTATYGYDTDISYNVWLTWWRKFSLLHGLDYDFQTMIQAPFGTDQVVPGFSALYLPMALIAIPFNEVAAQNIAVIAAFTLSGLMMFALARRVTHHDVASFAAGLIFAFSPYMTAHAPNHVDLAQQWVVPLFVLALVNLCRRQTVGSALWLGAGFALANYMNPYYGYQTAVAAFVFTAAYALVEGSRAGLRALWTGRLLRLAVLAGVVGVLLYLPEFIPVLRAAFAPSASPVRPGSILRENMDQFYYYSSRPWDFLLPPADHPLWGGIRPAAIKWLGDLRQLEQVPPLLSNVNNLAPFWYWIDEDQAGVMYPGYATLLMAGVALWRWRGRRTSIGETGRDGVVMLIFALGLVVAGYLFSQPPVIPFPGALLRHVWEPLYNFVLPTPTLLTMAIAPPLRIQRRFMVMIMTGLAVLSAVGLAHLLNRIARPAGRAALVAGFVAVLAVEFAKPVGLITPWEERAEFTWLAARPEGTLVATYPWGAHKAIAYQYVYEQPTVNVIARPHSPLDLIGYIESITLDNPVAPGTAARLAALGTEFIVNTDKRLPDDVSGLRLLFTTETAEVFAVTADPLPLAVLQTPSGAPWRSDADWGWQGATYKAVIWNPLDRTVEVDISLATPNVPAGAALRVEPSLTPHPDRIVWAGVEIDNPFSAPGYEGDYAAEPCDAGLCVEDMAIQRGETVLTFRWMGVDPAGGYPVVTGVEIDGADMAETADSVEK